jgi:microcompartment protein CcmK/EutM
VARSGVCLASLRAEWGAGAYPHEVRDTGMLGLTPADARERQLQSPKLTLVAVSVGAANGQPLRAVAIEPIVVDAGRSPALVIVTCTAARAHGQNGILRVSLRKL